MSYLTNDSALLQAPPCNELSFLLLPAQLITFGKEGALGLRDLCLLACFLGSSSFPGMCNTIDEHSGISHIVQGSSLWSSYLVSVFLLPFFQIQYIFL